MLAENAATLLDDAGSVPGGAVGRQELLHGLIKGRGFGPGFRLLGLKGQRLPTRILERNRGVLADGFSLVVGLDDKRLGELADADAEARRLSIPIVSARVQTSTRGLSGP
jgi:hypothetical protein